MSARQITFFILELLFLLFLNFKTVVSFYFFYIIIVTSTIWGSSGDLRFLTRKSITCTHTSDCMHFEDSLFVWKLSIEWTVVTLPPPAQPPPLLDVLLIYNFNSLEFNILNLLPKIIKY